MKLNHFNYGWMKRKKIRVFAFSILVVIVLFLFWPVRSELRQHGRLSLRIKDANGILLRDVLNERDELNYWAPLSAVSTEMKQAMIAAEDRRFSRHWGVDPLALARSLLMDIRHGRIVAGGSTITQQLARQVYDLPRRWYLKPLEMALAVRIECQLSKDDILEQYLNRMPFANQIFGIEAASRRYLNKPAAHLSLSEAALLAGLPQSPNRYNPYRRFDEAKKRQTVVLQRMLRNALIDSGRYHQALATPLQVSENNRVFLAPHFCQFVRRHGSIRSGELRTTCDIHVQDLVEDLVAGHLKNLKSQHVTNAAVLVVENRTHAIRAYVGSADFFNEEIQGQVDGVTSLRQPGSAVKPFTYGLALENGYTTASILPDIQTFASSTAGDFTVHNYDEKFHGPVRLRTALACSYNVPAVRLLESLGSDLLLRLFHLAGITGLDKPAAHYGLGLTLGNGDMTLYELTRAFTVFAHEGKLQPLLFQMPAENKPEVQVFSSGVAWLLTDILSDAQARSPAFGLTGPLHLPFPCAAKTGTTKDFRDNWTIGYTTDYTVGVWVGNFDAKPMRRISGITGAAPLFRDIMLSLHRKSDPAPFQMPPGVIKKNICSRSGQLAGSWCPVQMPEYFLTGAEPRGICSVHRVYRLDRRTGLVATRHTPAGQIEQRVFEIWPEDYSAWLQENNIPQPPLIAAQDTVAVAELLAVSFPDEGDIFKIDPILKREYQTLLFTAVAPAHVQVLQWLVDDEITARVARPFTFRWTLQRGNHRLAVQAEIQGVLRRSKEVHIRVF